ncbi:MAG: SAF domain-containing protein [Clostridium sp.]|nr:SAF domain-containing protein [Clostridium sp.]
MKRKRFRIKESSVDGKKNILPGAILSAFLAAVIVYLMMVNMEKNAMSAYEKGPVLVAAKELARGIFLTEENVETYFEEAQMEKKLIPSAALTDKRQLIGRMTAGDIDKGSMITGAMTEETQKMISAMKKPVIAGFKADDLYQVVSGVLRSGDRIHIYTVDEELRHVTLAWENVLVQQVFDSSGVVIEPEDKITAAGRVNIFLEQDSVESFFLRLSTGTLHVVKIWNKA